MTTQPLTPRKPAMVAVAPSANVLAHALLQYGIPTDAGNVEPTVTVTRISTRADLTAFLATVPSPSLPWCLLPGNWDYSSLVNSMRAYFGQEQTMSSCLDMLNNEYAVNPRNLRG